MNNFPIEFCTSINCSIEALMEEMKPAVTEKYKFEYRDRSITKTPLNFWDYRDFDAKKKLNELSIESSYQSNRV